MDDRTDRTDRPDRTDRTDGADPGNPAGAGAADLLLGLIGDNIDASRSPLLHRLAGRQNRLAVRYDRMVPPRLGQDFETVLAGLARAGYRGTNVTYPYKERVVPLVRIDDPLVRAIGAVNTVLFDAEGARGFNTDYTGFMAAYRRVRGAQPPGRVLLIGTGGVGRAVAFGLGALGAQELRLADLDTARAEALAADLGEALPGMRVSVWADPGAGAAAADGVINCTPLGMEGKPGTPLPGARMAGPGWAFDAVYTPPDTEFLRAADAAGRAVISGWELFFYQGVHAWDLFSGGLPLDQDALRRDLKAAP